MQTTIRRATAADIRTICRFRRSMFEELDGFDPARLEASVEEFRLYAERAIPSGEYVGWIAEVDGWVIGTCGLVFQQQPPHPLLRSERVGSVLNVFVDRAIRRKGVATRLVATAVDHCDAEGCGAVVLHASDPGRSVYGRLGFEPTSEMRRYLG